MSKMDRDHMREKLSQGFSELTPDRWEDIRNALSSAESISDQAVREETAARPAARRRFAMAAAAAAVMICAALFAVKDFRTVNSLLYLDVNPSVCISLNERGKVIDVEGINADGIRVVDSVKSKTGRSRSLDETVSGIIAETDKEGYFRDGSVDVLVSLSYVHKEDGSVLEQTCAAIEEYAASREMKSDILSQSFARDKAVEDAAEDIGISPGKYEFIVSLSDNGGADETVVREWANKRATEIIERTKNSPDEQTEVTVPVETDEETEQDSADAVTEEDEVTDGSENAGSGNGINGKSGKKKENASASDNGKSKEKADKDKSKENKKKTSSDKEKSNKNNSNNGNSSNSSNGSGKGNGSSGNKGNNSSNGNNSGKNNNGSSGNNSGKNGNNGGGKGSGKGNGNGKGN